MQFASHCRVVRAIDFTCVLSGVLSGVCCSGTQNGISPFGSPKHMANLSFSFIHETNPPTKGVLLYIYIALSATMA